MAPSTGGPEQTGRWTDFLASAGYRPGAVLGAGMEGTVIDLGDDLVAKIWQRRTAEELETLQVFYARLPGAQPAVADPADPARSSRWTGSIATVEPRLGGRPLWTPTARSPTLTDADVALRG